MMDILIFVFVILSMYLVGKYSLVLDFRKRLPIKNNIVEHFMFSFIVYAVAILIVLLLFMLLVKYFLYGL